MAPAPVRADAALSPGLIGDGGGDWTTGSSVYLEVSVNGSDSTQLAHFDERDGKLYARAATLRRLGFLLPDEGSDPLAPADLDGVAVDYDASRQRVAIQAPLRWLDLDTTRLNAPQNSVPQASGAPGLLLNYDLYGTRSGSAGSLDASTELRAFTGGAGMFSTTQLNRFGRQSGGDWRSDSVRLDSDWQLTFPESMLRLSVGDATTGALDWTRATHFAGVQIGRDFALQPYRITAPLPAFLGEATVPSTVDLYVGGMRQYSGQVPPGPFQLTTIPTITGAGVAHVVMTDALGRSRSYDLPLYGSRQLLQAGLSDWSVGVGFVRENYGLSSWDYAGKPMASASWRYGWSDHLTVEAHAEGAAGVFDGGGGGALQLGQAGILSGAVAHSQLHGRSGSLLHLGYDWTNGRFAFAVDSTRTYGDYADVATLYGPAPARISERALAGFNSDTLGNFGVGYVRLRQAGEAASRYASAYWSRTFGGRMSLNLGFNQNLDRAADRSAFCTLAFAFDDGLSLNAGVQRTRDSTTTTLDAGRPVPGDGGFGWRVQGRGGDQSGGVSTLGGDTYAYAEASGSLILMGGHAFAARRVDDAFAVVSTDGVADVPVKLENRTIGRTDADGMLLVTRLQAYQRNQLAIDPMDLPAALRVDRIDAIATPGDRAGTLVRFAITPIRAAELVLHDETGRPLPLGSRVQPDGAGETVVGFDGAVYLDDLRPRNHLDVHLPDGRRCHVEFDAPQVRGIAQLGALACRTEAPR